MNMQDIGYMDRRTFDRQGQEVVASFGDSLFTPKVVTGLSEESRD